MKLFFEEGKYTQWVEVDLKGWSCTCPDFMYRRLKKTAEGNYVLEMCKHMKKIVEGKDEEAN